MSLIGDLEKFANDIDNELKNLVLDIETDFEKAISFIDNELQKVNQFIENGLTDAEKNIIKNLQKEVLDKYQDIFSQFNTLVQKVKTEVDSAETIFNDIKDIVVNKSNQSVTGLLNNLTAITDIKNFYANLAHFTTITIGCDAQFEIVAGVQACGYGGIDFTDVNKGINFINDARVLVDMSASGGVEAGGDAGVTMGLWLDKPKNIQGGFIAAQLDATDLEGIEATLIFSISEHPDFIGIVIDFNAGADDGASFDCGYTLALKVVPQN